MSQDPTTVQWIGRAVGRVGRGLVVLARRGWRWPWSTAEGGSKLGRLLALGAGGWAVLRVTGALPWTRWILVVGLLAWAYNLDAQERARGSATTSTDEPVPDAPTGASPAELEHLREQLILRLRALIGDGNAVHLSTVHQLLQIEGLVANDVELPELRRMLGRAGIPVRDSVKVHGSVRVGVHRDDLPNPSPTASGEGSGEG